MGPAASWDDFAAACAALAGQEAPRLDPQRPVWIFGAGGFGRDLGRVLQAQGFALAGFIDSKPRQDSLLGLPVRSWQQLEARDFSAQLAIGIFNRDTPFDGLEAAARAAGFRDIFLPPQLYAQFAAQLGWRYWMSPRSTILDALPQIEATWRSLADDESCACLLGILSFRLGLNPGYAGFRHADEQYFNGLTLPALRGAPLRYVDAGAYNGDTYIELCRHADVAEAWLFEPDPANYAALVANVRQRGLAAQCIPAAVADRHAILSFNGGGEAGAIAEGGSQHILALALDDLLPARAVSFLKLDVEGAEAQALQGARRLIERCRPVLAMSLYHLPADPWELTALVRELCPGYRFHLRQHTCNRFDSVLYAVPQAA